MSAARRLGGRLVRGSVGRLGYELVRAQPPSSYLTQIAGDAATLPPDAEADLRPDHPRLLELKRQYAELDWPVTARSRWQGDVLGPQWLDLRFFRGESPFIWNYRETERVSRLKFFLFLRYVLAFDHRSLVRQLGEDNAFGAWVFRFPGYPTCSRDLLDSVNELYFLDRHLGVFERPALRVLDIGAGYGRLAHRSVQAIPNLSSYICVDAIPESTYLCEYYTRHRELAAKARVVALPDVPALNPGEFDLACNVHSFSEMPIDAIQWWGAQLSRLQPAHLLLVPNEASGFLSTEIDGRRLDYQPVIEGAGYRLVAEERVFTDDAVRELMMVDDRMCLFERA